MGDIEVQQKSKLEAPEAQIAEKLAAMHWQCHLDGFELNSHEIVNNKIDPVAVVDHQLFVLNWDQDLLAGRRARLSKLIGRANLVRRL